MPNFQKILVAGGHGFLGKHICQKLKEKGLDCQALGLEDRVDFRNFQQTKEIFERRNLDAVINCAAFVGGIKFGYEIPGQIFFNNILMAIHLMEAARITGVKRFINPISNCVYPAHLTEFKEEEMWSGPLHESIKAYAGARRASIIQGWAYHRQYGFETINLVLPNMYGPGDYFDENRSHALGALIKRFVMAKEEEQPEVVVWGSGKPIREWLYVEEGAEALARALDIPFAVEPINIGQGKGISIKELAELIKEIVGYQGKIVFDTSKPDGAPCKVMEVSKMKKLLNWQPMTGLKEGIKRTVEDYYQRFLDK